MSPLRDRFTLCPRCNGGLDVVRKTRLSCGGCRGELVPEREMLDQVSAAQAEALLRPRGVFAMKTEGAEPIEFLHALPPIDSSVTEATLRCPRCEVPMTKHTLFAVVLDRCAIHGMWLDGGELQRILEAATAGL